MMKLVTLLIVFVSLPPALAPAQSQSDVCHVATSWWNPAKGIGSGNMLLGQFRLSAFNEQALKSFKDEGSGLFVNAGVEYGDFGAASAGRPTEIRVAIAASDREQNAFDVTENAVAGTTYGRRWGSLYVEKQVVVGQLIHTFNITCGDGSKRKR